LLGRKECDDSIEYLKERVAIEEEYSKKLLKLAKSNDNKGGFGVEVGEDELNSTLRAAWKQVNPSSLFFFFFFLFLSFFFFLSLLFRFFFFFFFLFLSISKVSFSLLWKLREATEKIAQKHKQFADEVHSQIHQPMLNMKESQRKMVADTSEKVELSQKEFNNMRTLVPKLKKTYEGKCKELDATEQEHQVAVRNNERQNTSS
jgi:hypothetical protein